MTEVEGRLDTSMLDPGLIPDHVGLILDGNGRWANARGLPRTAGHLAGEEALFDTVEGAVEIGIKWLTAFTFSTENWSRSDDEVEFLMWFNEDLLLRRRDDLNAQGVRMRFAGYMKDPRIPDRNREHMADAEEKTKENEVLNLVFAFNYGARREIVEGARILASRAVSGDLRVDDIDEDALRGALYIPEMPDVDLIIRSSGEHRLSNFLLWQSAYAEFYFPGILWPDFDRHALLDAVIEYQSRDRRFGGADDKPD
ncbi:MAG: polyprenyl diphosphate synthase [Acidimicrobiia bacterium]|jgi:undecaprenyl diphosphate synthase